MHESVEVVSQSPGRLRIRVDGLKNPYFGQVVEREISALPFVISASNNPRTGKVLVLHHVVPEAPAGILANIKQLVINFTDGSKYSVPKAQAPAARETMLPDALAGTTSLLAFAWGQPVIGAGVLGLAALHRAIKAKTARNPDCQAANCAIEKDAGIKQQKLSVLTAAAAAGTYLVTGSPQRTLSALVAGNPLGSDLNTKAQTVRQTNEWSEQGIRVRNDQVALKAAEVDTVVLTNSSLLNGRHRTIEQIIPVDKSYSAQAIAALVLQALENQNKHNLTLIRQASKNLNPINGTGKIYLDEKTSLVLKENNSEIIVSHAAYLKKRRIPLSQARLIAQRVIQLGGYPLYVVVNGKVTGIIGLQNRVSPEGWALLRGLRSLGIRHIGLLTDEGQEMAGPVGLEAGLSFTETNLDGEAKQERLKNLKLSGKTTAVVVSSPKDYPALEQADVGISVGNIKDEGVGQVFILGPDAQQRIVSFFLQSHLAAESYRQTTVANLGGSIIGLGLAALGWLSAPWALLFATSSLLVPGYHILKRQSPKAPGNVETAWQEVAAAMEPIDFAGTADRALPANLSKEEAWTGDSEISWHAITREQLLAVLAVPGFEGLRANEVAERRQVWGFNELEQKPRTSWWRLLVHQLSDFMIKLLLGIAGFSLFVGKPLETLTIVSIVLVNAAIGVWQEIRSEKSLSSLEQLTVPEATVVRDGIKQVIPARELVPGDIILLEAGDKVPADARVLEVLNLEVEEASLTGEHLPVVKDPDLCSDITALGDRKNMLYLGTCVTKGKCKAVVVATGMHTEMGRITCSLQTELIEEQTPLQRRLEELGKYLVWGSLAICGLVFGLGVIRGQGFMNMFLTATSLAVAAIPEGLTAIVTVALALSVHRMSKRHLIVKKLHAIETLGCTTAICSDKTGTITKNEMTVRAVYSYDNYWGVTGEGYEPKGELTNRNKVFESEAHKDLELILRIGVLCNNAKLLRVEGCGPGQKEQWQIQGDATEGALLTLAAKNGFNQENLDNQYERISEEPFEAERGQMSVTCRDQDGLETSYVKGSVDKILDQCSHVMKSGNKIPISPNIKQTILNTNSNMTNAALRVLAVAFRDLSAEPGEQTEASLVFAGLVGMQDPPRPEVRESLKKCNRAGVKVIMITGDHAMTAAAVAREIGLINHHGRVITGAEIDTLSDSELERIINDVRVCARATPQHKLRLVKALQRQGHIVAMTGDGVNDAPAVKQADIGVVMGKGGTDVTKDVSSMIINDDNFATIVYGVEEGRTVYRNIRHAIRYLLATNVGEVVVIFLASLIGLPMPLTASQLLWLNLSGDALPAIALVSNQATDKEMQATPRKQNESVFAHGLGRNIIRRGFLIGLGALTSFIWGLRRSGIGVARSMVLASLGVSQLLHLFDCRHEKDEAKARLSLRNPYMVAAGLAGFGLIVGSIYIPGLAGVFQTAPLGLSNWLVVLAGAAAVLGTDWMFSLR